MGNTRKSAVQKTVC